MIPKIIHYCWFGGKKNKLVQKCINTWRLHLPDYEIIEWNDSNFDVSISNFTEKAYEYKKYAYVSDYVRLWALYNFGGIYLDADVEVIRNLDCFLIHRFFTGFESLFSSVTGIIGAEKGHPFLEEALRWYDSSDFIVDKMEPNTKVLTKLMIKRGVVLNGEYQILNDDMHIYPQDYFCPYDIVKNKLEITDNTYTIHYFQGSWLSPKDKIKLKLRNILIDVIGYKRFKLIKSNIGKYIRR